MIPSAKRYLLCATVADRVDSMRVCAQTISAWLPNWSVVVVTQEYGAMETMLLKKALPTAIVIDLPKRVGMHNAKATGLRYIKSVAGNDSYVVCSIDDDMEFTDQTHLDPCVFKCLNADVGFVSAGWVAHPNHIAKRKNPSVFVQQPIVYTGGGMVFDNKTADIILSIPDGAYVSDNTEWSIASYVAGLQNFRYRGSLSVHRICQRGGRRGWVSLADRKIPDPAYLVMRMGVRKGKHEWLIGASKDLTPFAHEQHRLNLKKRRIESIEQSTETTNGY